MTDIPNFYHNSKQNERLKLILFSHHRTVHDALMALFEAQSSLEKHGFFSIFFRYFILFIFHFNLVVYVFLGLFKYTRSKSLIVNINYHYTTVYIDLIQSASYLLLFA